MSSAKNKTTQKVKTTTVGILGGTFDPIHNGHIEPAISVANHLNLGELRLLPAHIPPHKETPSATPQHREAMAKLVCQHNPIFALDNRELTSKKTSYSVYTLKALKAESPNTTYFFIMGMDSLQTFTTWHLWKDILNTCHIIVNIRPGYSLKNFNDASQALLKNYQCHNIENLFKQDHGYIYIHEGIKKDISSTQIRNSLKGITSNTSQENVFANNQLLPDYIQNYIDKHQLYS